MISLAAGGFFGYGGDGGPALAAQLNQPASVAFDKNGNLYFADRLNHRVRRISPAGIIRTFAGTGSSGSGGDGGRALLALFDKPGTIAIDVPGNLYVSDITGSILSERRFGISTPALRSPLGTAAPTFQSYFQGSHPCSYGAPQSMKTQGSPHWGTPIPLAPVGALERQRTLHDLFSEEVKETSIRSDSL